MRYTALVTFPRTNLLGAIEKGQCEAQANQMVRHLIPHEIRQIAQVPFSRPYQQVIQNRTYIGE
jgi:hypothetical protein